MSYCLFSIINQCLACPCRIKVLISLKIIILIENLTDHNFGTSEYTALAFPGKARADKM